MEKQKYERIKALKEKAESGKATFKERNIYNIIQKRKAKGQPIDYNNHAINEFGEM